MYNAPYMNYVFSKPYCPAYTNTQGNVFEQSREEDIEKQTIEWY